MELSIIRCTTTELRKEAKTLVNTHHSYIKWADRPSRKIYWLCCLDNQFVGVFGLGSAFSKPNCVSAWMNSHNVAFNELANNIVYCLMPNLPRNSGTSFLKLLRHDAKRWWQDRYGDDLLALQIFILPPRTGAMYKADNWEYLGMTSGKTQKMITIYGDDPRKEWAERRVFKSGEIKYLLREFTTTEPKLMFVKLL